MTQTIEALLQQALAAHRSGNSAQAERLIREAMVSAPDNAVVHRALATVLLHRGDAAGAEPHFARASALGQNDPALFFSLGHTQIAQSKWSEALKSYDRAIALKPDFLEAIANRGILLQQLDRPADALAAFEKAVSLNPRLAETHIQRGSALVSLGRLDDGIDAFRTALALEPRHTRAWFNLAATLTRMQDYTGALSAYDSGLAIAPDPAMRLDRFFTAFYVCDWRGPEGLEKELLAAVERGGASLHPFQMQFLPVTPARQYRTAADFMAKLPPQKPLVAPTRKPGRLRIAYLTGDVRQHPVAYLMAETLERHDRAKFEVFVFSHGPGDASTARSRIKAAAEHFIDMAAKNDISIAERIAERDIDILIDLSGHSPSGRPAILSHRPARLQVNYLGYCGTMGGAFHDYLIGDALITPPEHQPFYSEKLALLPYSYLPASARPEPQPLTRTESGLPETGFVFCAFTAPYKIMPAVFGHWMRLLLRTKESVLWLRGGDPAMQDNLKREAQSRGVDPARLVFAPHAPASTYFSRLALADLCLDTFVYGAHTTAADTLWAGTPMVTRLGETFSARVAAGLLTHAGVGELIAATPDDYENIAAMLASDASRLAALKDRLKALRATTPLFDSARFARDLESAYAAMWARHESGEAPAPFSVPA